MWEKADGILGCELVKKRKDVKEKNALQKAMKLFVFGLLLASLLYSINGLDCGPNTDITCPEELAETFLSIQDSVTKRTLTARGLLDVVFVIDEGALKPEQHYWTTQLLHILSEAFIIAPDYTRASIVTYSSSARVIVSLPSNADICSFTSSINNMTFKTGYSYLSNGLGEALRQLNAGRLGATKLTILITNGEWGNLGADPQAYVTSLKNSGYFSAVILKQQTDVGLMKDVIIDNFVSQFGSKKLGFTADMTPEYLRKLHDIVIHNKASGTDWPLDIKVDKNLCASAGRSCAATEDCVCEARTIAKEYICIGQDDVDPPEVVACKGPNSPVIIQDANSTSTKVDWAKPLFSDNAGVVNTVSDKWPGFYKAGSYDVTSTATDSNKNSATCSFSFTVKR
ncbi:sushi, von Willebrand factor type A, EGF and pentraxin domain-containing protein 1-like [Watersipora subatra]|uniref:sushi, von Willebrand factor type A, EGF and pentraxin domain-containing protein 1-like n=1 Tax=Watersipora subatra TaxID=2589382 RepID=UPI00355BB943